MIQVLAVMSSHAGILHCSSDLGKVPNTDNSVLCFIYNPYLSRSKYIHGNMYVLEVFWTRNSKRMEIFSIFS